MITMLLIGIPITNSSIELRLAKFYKRTMFLPGTLSENIGVLDSTRLEILVRQEIERIKDYTVMNAVEYDFLEEFKDVQ